MLGQRPRHPFQVALPPGFGVCYKVVLIILPPLGMDPVYKLLLCMKYLRTRYLAFVCIVSVMLGVATLIVVNSVMSGFSNKLKDRLHGILSEVMIETERSEGFDESPEEMMARIKASSVGQHIESMSPTVEVFALLQFQVRDKSGRKVPITKHVRMVGVDAEKHAKVGRFAEYLVRQKNSPSPDFNLTKEALERFEHNQWVGAWDPFAHDPKQLELPIIPQAPIAANDPVNRFREKGIILPEQPIFPAPKPVIPEAEPPRLPSVILGYSIAHHRWTDPVTNVSEEYQLLRPGDDVFLMTYNSSGIRPAYSTFAVCDYFKCEMSEYDNSFVYVALDELQRLRGMNNRVNSIQMKLKPEVASDTQYVHGTIIPELQKLFGPTEGRVVSWQQHQGPLLEAIDVERGILNLLLFMIVGVSGFSVLAIFSMIVAEKYRDIGIMKSLGASDQGVMAIFLSYGLMLGLVGCGLGTILGLAITVYINEIEGFLTMLTNQQIFDRKIYYFDKIPTNIEAMTVGLVNFGAILISVAFSVLPALRAARLHPVRALRFE